MFNNPIVDITKGISSLYISGKKRKRSDILKSNGSIANKLKDLKNRFKDLGLMYDELEEQLSDVHFMNISDIKNYKRNTNKKYKKYRNIPNHLKSFNYNYNNLNDYYYNLYKKITNKKQKVTEINKDKEKEKKIYKIDNEISIKFNDTNINTKGLNFGSIDKQNVTNINTIMKENFNNSRPKKYNRYSNQKYRKQNNFIPSGIKIPNKFESNNKILNDVNKGIFYSKKNIKLIIIIFLFSLL
ncbi:hypothetical protein BCR36DRAFT_69883 [Piromyces finnis]|uniref:Uncharacterized protein n=1 Tax=Piromyces finnis TaxID=1754191 RepID=A0A1Y1V7D4_9FUNG|nr:hypothetical protein BCR36DRAFT_69883 [Piromyces finnis]|eukprot:ORX48930.1 hypothetical protein BCR36DRAFT_69883 [Piromyces finnis]